ncbi:MAG: nucleoside-diphosphate kinase [bacterium]|nr:nucleoside-diphosphate kinase [bacterium]
MNKIQQTLVIVKPDGLIKSLTGNILTALSETKLKIVGAKILKVPKKLAEIHYQELKFKKPKVFPEAVKYLMGGFHTDRVLALVYQGQNAVNSIRKICGSTNPEEADSTSIRGRYGRINSKTGVFENVIHTSESVKNAEKEIKLWFKPEELTEVIFKTKKLIKTSAENIWA